MKKAPAPYWRLGWPKPGTGSAGDYPTSTVFTVKVSVYSTSSSAPLTEEVQCQLAAPIMPDGEEWADPLLLAPTINGDGQIIAVDSELQDDGSGAVFMFGCNKVQLARLDQDDGIKGYAHSVSLSNDGAWMVAGFSDFHGYGGVHTLQRNDTYTWVCVNGTHSPEEDSEDHFG